MLLAAQGSLLAFTISHPGPCSGYSGLAAGFTNQLQLLRVFKLLPSCNEEYCCIDARVQAGLHIESLAVPGVRLGRGCRAGWMPTAPSLIPLAKPSTHSLCVLPVIGLLQVPGSLEARAEEHVLVDSATHAVQIWCHGTFMLHQWQQHSQGFLPVPRPVPPKAVENGLKMSDGSDLPSSGTPPRP